MCNHKMEICLHIQYFYSKKKSLDVCPLMKQSHRVCTSISLWMQSTLFQFWAGNLYTQIIKEGDARNPLPMHKADQRLPGSVLGGQCVWLPAPPAPGEWCAAAARHWSSLFQNFLCIVGDSHRGLLRRNKQQTKQCTFRMETIIIL